VSSSNRTLQRWLNAIPRRAVYIGGALPGVWIFWRALNDQLGADPLAELEHLLGLWSLRFIIAGLAVSPSRKFGGPNLVRYRRALGLLAFFYACVHLLVWLVLDRGFDLNAIGADLLKRPYITIGMLAFAILLPLAITSNATMIKRLGGAAWQRLHRWVYLAAIAAAVHYLMVVKAWRDPGAFLYAGLIALLLVTRLIFAARKRLSQRSPMAPSPADA
jgi:sulfoxide reductase heme-binding subunit YedZ